MLTLDIASTLPQQEVVMITQAGQSVPASAQTYARTFKMQCQDVVRVRQGEEALADQPNLYDPSRQIAFVHVVLEKLGYKDVGGRYINMPTGVFEGVKTGILEAPKHGKLTAQFVHGYDYKPDADYLGRDRIVFWVEVAGSRYRVIGKTSQW